MKSKITSAETDKQFKPFTLEITVESIQEARSLFNLFNTTRPQQMPVGYYTNQGEPCSRDVGSGETWELIGNAIKSQGFEL